MRRSGPLCWLVLWTGCATAGGNGADPAPAGPSPELARARAAALAPAPAAAAAAGTAPVKVTEVEGITEYRLANGLRVLLFPDASKPTVTVNLTVFVGSRHEGYGETGMAHLLEHMLFKGTPTHPNIWKQLQDRGANFNGTTWYDRTNYYEELPASPENLEFAIGLEADRMVNSTMAAEELAKEFSVVRNEFEMGENNPAAVLEEKMFAAAYQWHNYGKSTIGSRSDIERVPVDNLRAFYRRFYQPDNALLVVAGKFDPERALRAGESALRRAAETGAQAGPDLDRRAGPGRRAQRGPAPDRRRGGGGDAVPRGLRRRPGLAGVRRSERRS